MTFSEYAEKAALTTVYPRKGYVEGLIYCAFGLGGEAGEVLEQVKKMIRDDEFGALSLERRERIKLELGDVLWYVSQLAAECGLSLEKIAQANIEKLARRQAEGKIHGAGSTRLWR